MEAAYFPKEMLISSQELMDLAASSASPLPADEAHPAVVSQQKARAEHSEENSINDSNTTLPSTTSSKMKRLSIKGARKRSQRLLGTLSHGIGSVLHRIGHHHHHRHDHRVKIRHSTTIVDTATRVRGGVRLRGCLTDDEHREKVREIVQKLRPLRGKEGLEAAGFEYRSVPVPDDSQHDTLQDIPPELQEEAEVEERDEKPDAISEGENGKCLPEETTTDAAQFSMNGLDPANVATKLFHRESDTLITIDNRKEFISDGDMYDQTARLCQEYAQDIMLEDGNLEWVTISEAGNNPEPIRAIVSTSINTNEDALDNTPTLLIATGNGKVRAGIFSRHHLLISGMECSTALPIVREARKRKMNIIMLDPNVHGDRLGMVTFEKSMGRIFHRWESDSMKESEHNPPLGKRDLFILSHSQSGAQFARYLLDKSKHYLPHIRAVAFTDSTHNIQWARKDKDLLQLLESEKSVYFKVSKEGSENCLMTPLDSLGRELDVDPSWHDRFGSITTRCAGTNEHSLTNWFARHHIWEHFDFHLKELPSSDSPSKSEQTEEK